MSNSKAENINRQQAIHNGDAPRRTYAYFYCDENQIPTKFKDKLPACNEVATAWTFDDPGRIWSAHYVIFCPTFFSSRMYSLAELVALGKKYPSFLLVFRRCSDVD
jgi:hypothetical protein